MHIYKDRKVRTPKYSIKPQNRSKTYNKINADFFYDQLIFRSVIPIYIEVAIAKMFTSNRAISLFCNKK